MLVRKDHNLRIGAFSHPIAKFHAMDLFDIKYNFSQICHYVKRTVPSRHTLAGLVPGPGKRKDPQLPRFMIGNPMSNLCQLLDSLSWILNEKTHVQDLAGISGNDYT